jgi:adenylate kinase
VRRLAAGAADTARRGAGRLIDDELMTEIVVDRMGRTDAEEGFLLDGFPRTVTQAETLDMLVAARDPLVVVYVSVEESEVLRRLAARMVCAECGAKVQDDKDFSTCHDCGGVLVPRVDDVEEVVRARMEAFRRQTEPLLDYYLGRPTFVRVDGARLVDEVTAAIAEAVESVRARRKLRGVAGPRTDSRGSSVR